MSVESKETAGRLGEASLPAALPMVGGQQGALALPEFDFVHGDDGIFNTRDEVPVAARYTAARFRAERPDDYQRAVKLVGEGRSREEVCRLLRIHHRTLAAAVEIEGLAVDQVKAQTKRGLRAALAIAADRAPDVMRRLEGVPMFIAAGIVADKLAQMDGEPIQVNVNVTHHRGTDWSKVNEGPFADAIDVTPSSSEQRVASSEHDGTKDTKPGMRV